MAELFIEVGVEELPARFVESTAQGLAANLVKLLGALASGAPRVFATPRRVAVAFADVAETTPKVEKLVTGAAVGVAFRDGAPTPAASAFAARTARS